MTLLKSQSVTGSQLHALPEDLLSIPVGDLATHPVAVYLARLGPGSRRSQRAALVTMAEILSAGRVGIDELPWHHLRYPYTQALRAALAERFSPATANRHLAALRGVLREAWRLGLMSAEDLQRSIDLPAVRGERLPRGRALRVANCERSSSPVAREGQLTFVTLLSWACCPEPGCDAPKSWH